MITATLTALAGAACLLFASTAVSAGNTAPVAVRETLKVESRQGRVLVHITIDNRGSRAVYVPRAIATEQELFGRLFEVRDSATGELLDYTGIMVKRGPYERGDFVMIKPHGRRHNTIDITRSYAFKPGSHSYTLRHEGSVLADLAHLDAVTMLEPASAAFSHSAP